MESRIVAIFRRYHFLFSLSITIVLFTRRRTTLTTCDSRSYACDSEPDRSIHRYRCATIGSSRHSGIQLPFHYGFCISFDDSTFA